jgi:Tfp pilus assembly protein PilF
MLGTTYLLINDKLSSEKSLLKSIEIYPGYRDAVLALGNLYRAERRNEDAKQVVNKYLEIVPKDTAALSFINKLGDTQSLFK